MPATHIAVISDIHGNSWALDRVIEDIRLRNITRILNLGDSAYGPLDPAGTIDRLMNLQNSFDIVSIRGNHDRMHAEPVTSRSPKLESLVRSALSERHLDWLASLPERIIDEDGLFFCHGTPESDSTYLLESISQRGFNLRPREEIEGELKAVSQPLILCGHSHLPRTVLLSEDRIVMNPGSVGLQAFTATTPLPHKVATSSPHARYLVLTKNDQGWNAEHVKVEYEWNRAAKRALEQDCADWARWISTGLT